MNKLIFSFFVVILLTSILFVMNFKKPISNLSQDDIPKTVVKPYKPDLNYPDLVIEGIEKALKNIFLKSHTEVPGKRGPGRALTMKQ